jgi:beta-glucosidase
VIVTTANPSTASASTPFRDPSRSIAERVQDLLSRLTLQEKISQTCNACPAIPRLGIPAYDYWSEALHGVARNGRATVFPQAIGMAATWDSALVQRIATAISDEGRAKYHEALRRNGGNLIYQGLTFWSPNVNIFRDPRWGRGQETWGEDPFLTGEMGSAFVRGIQGEDPKYLKAAACAKHYAVHSGPEKERHTFDARVGRRDLYATYLPAFKKLVTEAKVEAVMGAYNRTNGEPCCASPTLLGDILRGEWGFQGHVVSDCGAIADIHQHHHITADAAESAALSVKAGCDNSCICTFEHLGEAVERGLITEAEIDRSLGRTLVTRFKLGMFDPAEQVPYASIPLSVVACEEHRRLAYEAAVKSTVLLKNADGILPIGKTVRSILVVGPNATSSEVLLGNYYGLSDSLVTLLEGIANRAPEGVKIEYRPGCQLIEANRTPGDWSIYEAAASDLVIACMGLSPLIEGEEGDAILSAENGDRADIGLPAPQVDYLKKLIEVGAKVVLVLAGGSPIVLGELADLVQAVVYVWYPGQEGGNAVADVLFGNSMPSGKLPLTFPRSIEQLPPFEDYRMTGRTYRYATSEALYPFGFGLSYTRFAYSGMTVSSDRVQAGQALEASVTVTNTGPAAGEEVVQVYLSDLAASVEVPLRSLVAFRRIALAPGQSQEVRFTITPQMMMLIDDAGEPVLEPGHFRLTIGGCSPGVRGAALGAPEPVSEGFEMRA